MDTKQLAELFEKYEDEYLKTDRILNKLTTRPDLHAFLLLDKLVPCNKGVDMICGTGHDEIFLSIEVEELAEVATEDQIIELIRCGLRYNTKDEYFWMFT